MISGRKVRVAILDLYEGQANQGMRCIRDLLAAFARAHDLRLTIDEFEVRLGKNVPDLSYDIFISSGGPGSPLDSINSAWEKAYFRWLGQIEAHNRRSVPAARKHVLFICHSFQLICRHYAIAEVASRRSTAFGVFPVHLLDGAIEEPVFAGLQDPFYAVDSRSFQVIQPNHQRVADMGGHILAIEKERPHVPLERAIMAVRFSDTMIGTQFHPEADPIGMSMYLRRDDRKQIVIAEHGEEKWKSMIDHLEDPDKIRWTYSHVIPNFLSYALEQTGILHTEPA
jgi:homoserine O-succinyltransferase/O-acetyltransferase